MDSNEKILKGLSLFGEGVTEVFLKFSNTFVNAINNMMNRLNKETLNKKITKKRFCKLLQSQGVQRNEINEIIKGNIEPYTIKRYLLIINNRRTKQI